MNFKLENLLSEINKLSKEVSLYSSNELVYNYFRLIELIDFYNYIDYTPIDARNSVSVFQMQHIKNYNYNLNAMTSLSIFQNMDFYKQYSKIIYSKINDLSLKMVGFKELKEAECLSIIKEFLISFDSELFEYFKYIIEKNRIHFGKTRINTSYSGLTTLYSENPYIICNQKRFDLISAFIIIHELGHVLNRIKTQNYSHERLLLIPGSLYEEVTPMFLEKIFLDYLIDNDLFKKEATYLKKDSFNELKEYSKLLYLIANMNNMTYDDEFRLKTSSNKIKNLIKGLNIKYCEYPIEYLQTLNIKEIIRYFNGILLGLEYVSEYRNNSRANNIYDFISNIDLIEDDKVNTLLKNSKVLEKEL